MIIWEPRQQVDNVVMRPRVVAVIQQHTEREFQASINAEDYERTRQRYNRWTMDEEDKQQPITDC